MGSPLAAATARVFHETDAVSSRHDDCQAQALTLASAAARRARADCAHAEWVGVGAHT